MYRHIVPVLGVSLLTIGQLHAGATLRVPKDHASIQAAIDAAKAGDTVLVEAGTYRESVRLKPGLIVRSAGDDTRGKIGLRRAEATVIDGGGKAAKRPGVIMAADAVLDGFTVTNVGAYDDASWKRHHATHGAELKDEEGAVGTGTGFPAVAVGATCALINNIVHHNGHAGIGIRGGKDKTVAPRVLRNAVYRNMGGGIGSADLSTAHIEENTCFENLRGGIGNRNASPTILNNICHGNVRAGIGVREGARPIVRGNKCHGNRRAGIGVRMKGTAPIIEDNDCYENEMAGIGNRDGATPLIRNNRCYRNRMAGIGSRSGARALIEGNECYENDMAGIGSRLRAAPVIRNNRCYRNKMAGIGARERARPIIEDNECFENGMAGIGNREEAEPVIRGNRCYKNGMAGIGSRLGARPVIVDNDCYENEMAGIGTREGARAVICYNRATKNAMAGIGTRDGGRNVIIGNESKQNQMAGIGVRTASSRSLIIGNQCLENRLVAIGLPDGASAYIHGNDLLRTGGGAPPLVAVKGGSSAVFTDNRVRGGGVASLLVQGRALVVGNLFEGRGPDKQGSAIWVWDKSSILASGNRFNGYRNALNASGSSVTALDNQVADFKSVGIIVRKPLTPPRVLGNIALSDDAKAEAASIEGDPVKSAGNERQPAENLKKLSPLPRLWTLPADDADESYAQHQKVFGPDTVTDGPWKLVVTRGAKNTTYRLLHAELDPDGKTDFSELVPHLAFRLKGARERLEAKEFKSGAGR